MAIAVLVEQVLAAQWEFFDFLRLAKFFQDSRITNNKLMMLFFSMKELLSFCETSITFSVDMFTDEEYIE